jgi:hypothetical protein
MRIVLYLYKIVIKITSDIPFTLDKTKWIKLHLRYYNCSLILTRLTDQ